MSRGMLRTALTLLLAAGMARAAAAAQESKPNSKTQQSAPAEAANNGYVISPGDVIQVEVWKEPDVSMAVPVRPDGKISLPLLNDVQASGLTASVLAADLTEGLKKFIADPQVTVIVTQVNSQRIYISGEVNRGGTYPLEPGMTVLQGLSSAGGFTAFANVKKIYVLRQVGGKQVRYPFNYRDVVKGKNTEQNILLQPGDTIVVP